MNIYERNYSDYVTDIKVSIEYIVEFTADLTFNDFQKDVKTQYAVIRCFEVIGEAACRMPDDFKSSYPSVLWKIMTGMRNRLIHGSNVVDVTILWRQ